MRIPVSENCLKFVRTVLALRQWEFAEMLGFSLAQIKKLERMDLRKRGLTAKTREIVFRVTGAILQPDLQTPARDLDGRPYDKVSWDVHRKQHLIFVKYPLGEIMRGSFIIGTIFKNSGKEHIFCQGITKEVQRLARSPWIRELLQEQVALRSGSKNARVRTTLHWLSKVGNLPTEGLGELPTLAPHLRMAKRRIEEILKADRLFEVPDEIEPAHMPNPTQSMTTSEVAKLDSSKPQGGTPVRHLPRDSHGIGKVGLTARQQIALSYVIEQGYITNREFRQLVSIPRRTSTRDLGILVSRGVLITIGNGRGVRYILADKWATNAPSGSLPF